MAVGLSMWPHGELDSQLGEATPPHLALSVGEDDGWKLDGWMFATDQLAKESGLYFIVNYVK